MHFSIPKPPMTTGRDEWKRYDSSKGTDSSVPQPPKQPGLLDGICMYFGGVFHSTSRFEMRKIAECINAFYERTTIFQLYETGQASPLAERINPFSTHALPHFPFNSPTNSNLKVCLRKPIIL